MAAAPAPPPPVTMEQVRAAQTMLRDIVPESRLLASPSLSKQSGGSVFLKLECEGPTGSFKVRGAYHAIKTKKMPFGGGLPGVTTASTGNHGAAVAYAASKMRIPARVYLPENPNPAKKQRIQQLGAEIVEAGKFLEDTREHAAKYAERSGWYNVVDGVDALMLPGTGTIGCEIIDKLPTADVIFVPVGDSTLIRGLAFAAKQLRPTVNIVGVQAERAPAYALAFTKGHAISTDNADTIADGLSVRDAMEDNVKQIQGLVDEFQLVSEEEMLTAMRHLHEVAQVTAEPAGAATTAAFLKSPTGYAGKSVVLLVTGSNAPSDLVARALQTPRRA
jgi:threonine dehydratase